MKRKVKLRVKIFCALGAVYFLFVLCMTVYAQTTHINALPTVTLMRVEDGVVPREAVYGNRQRGYRVYTVKQEDGAFGKAYFLHVVESEKIFSTEQEGKVLIGALRRETNPVAFEIHLSENEMPYEGMEVKIVGYKWQL